MSGDSHMNDSKLDWRGPNGFFISLESAFMAFVLNLPILNRLYNSWVAMYYFRFCGPLFFRLEQRIKPLFRTRRVFPQISNVWSSLVSSSRMAELFLTTTSRKSQLFTWFFASVVVCKSSSRHSPARPSPLRSRLLTPSRTWRLRFRYVTTPHL